MRVGLVLAVTIAAGFGISPVAAQIVPAQPLDAPSAPLSGPPLNRPPRQLPPESDAASDPALTDAHNPGQGVGANKGEQACALAHSGYNAATRSYVDEHGHQHSCG